MRALLTKLDSDRKHGTDFGNKFVAKVGEIFSGLPKPKEWQAFHNHDLPGLTSAKLRLANPRTALVAVFLWAEIERTNQILNRLLAWILRFILSPDFF